MSTIFSKPTRSGFQNRTAVYIPASDYNQSIPASRGTKLLLSDLDYAAKPEHYPIGKKDPNGDVIVNQRDQVYAASIAAGVGGTVWLDGATTYTIDIDIPVYANQRWIGNNCTLKRADAVVTTLAAAALATDTTVQVVSATGFRVGHKVLITDTSAPNGGLGVDENNGVVLKITAINANTLTFSAQIGSAMDIGDKVGTVVTLLADNFGGGRGGRVTIQGINFDGNRANNLVTHDWKHGATVSLADADDLIIRDCDFKATHSENMVVGNCRIENCTYSDLAGSFFHLTDDLGGNRKLIICDRCEGSGSNKFYLLVGHGSSLFEYSANVTNLQITNGHFSDGDANVIGGIALDDERLLVANCTFQNFGDVIGHTTSTSDVQTRFYDLRGNRFESCGDINMQAKDVRKGFATRYLNIKDNTFINTRCFFTNTVEAALHGNVFGFEEGLHGFNSATAWASGLSGQLAFVQFLNFTNLSIRGNSFIGPETLNTNVRMGVLLQDNFTKKTTGSVDTNYRYAQNVDVCGNTVYNFRFGIGVVHDSPQAVQHVREYVGWDMSHNKVYMSKDASIGTAVACGIHIPPGAKGEGNIVIPGHDSLNAWPIIASGIHDDSTTKKNELQGAIAINNRVVGNPSRSMLVGGTAGANQYNVVSIGNLLPKAAHAEATAAAQSKISDTILDSTNLPSLTDPQTPVWTGPLEDAGLY